MVRFWFPLSRIPTGLFGLEKKKEHAPAAAGREVGPMTRRILFFWVLGCCLALGVTTLLVAVEKEGKEKEFPWDKGPDTIDVSQYPPEQQANYKAFARKCSKCHTLARAINAPYALPAEWETYIRMMQAKKRSGLDAESAKKVLSFLKYDSSLRKKDLIEKKLKGK
ncbi:MAG: hypothetical protein HYZ73_03215 [Elusimicrobia bacterium]|nr:hypothetical protein [Elusimicrobiota bacterium]